MSKLRKDLRLALAGACSGLFSVSVFLLGYRLLAYYDHLASRQLDDYEISYSASVHDLWWLPVVIWHVVLSVVASLLVHRYIDSSQTSTFFRWQIIGFIALAGWSLTVFTGITMDCMIRGNTVPVDHALRLVNLIPAAQFVAGVFASNVLYGTAIHVASTEDTLTQNEVT